MENNHLSIYKVSHPVKMRMLQVVRTYWLTPYLLSIILTGEELSDFVSLSFNDHVKLFFPEPGKSKPTLPQVNPNGSLDVSEMRETIKRDFTPFCYDPQKRELELQIFIHQNRQASNWATHTKPGDYVGIGGPKKSLIISNQFDWFLMLGDETAIPAIGRRLEELPRNTKITVMIETEYPDILVDFKSKATVNIHWIDKNKYSLLDPLVAWPLPEGEGFIWAAGEFSSMQAIYTYLINSGSIEKSRLKISSYWRKGYTDTHGTFGKD